MMLPNNPAIETKALNDKAKGMAAYRRRDRPLFSGQGTGHAVRTDLLQAAPAGMVERLAALKALIVKIPVLGVWAVKMHRFASKFFASGLHWKQRVHMIPVVGALGAWAFAIVRLERTSQQTAAQLAKFQQFESAAKNVLAQTNARISQLETLELNQHLQLLDQRLVQLEALELGQRLVQLEALELRQRLVQLEAFRIAEKFEWMDKFAADTAVGNMMHDNRVASLTRELRSFNPTVPAVATGRLGAAAAMPQRTTADRFYTDFEDTFRGSRADITERVKVYLPYFEKFKGDQTAHIVDIGCGRGEWLGLLRENDFEATGIDLNAAMVAQCHELGLKAQCTEAIDFLHRQPAGSLAAVTGFHIIEHIAFDALLALFDAALLALRPDGLIIFETPNAENLSVGACNFYYDPTHLHPIIPVVAEFMARQRGFAHAEILRLHPYPESYHLAEDSELAKRFNHAMYGPQDYALLAWKTHEI